MRLLRPVEPWEPADPRHVKFEGRRFEPVEGLLLRDVSLVKGDVWISDPQGPFEVVEIGGEGRMDTVSSTMPGITYQVRAHFDGKAETP